MNIDIAKQRCEKLTKQKVVKGVRYGSHYIFEVDNKNPFSTPYYAIDDRGKITSFSPSSDLDGFFNVWSNAIVWIKKEYPEVIE